MKIKEYSAVFLIGAAGYGTLELLARGYTHWTMLITGGSCFSFMYLTSRLMQRNHIVLQALCCGIAVTEIEFLVGCLVNKVARMGVWDYSSKNFDVLGQICPQFSLIWVALSFPALLLCKRIRYIMEEKHLKREN